MKSKLLFFALFFAASLQSQTTGKISGSIIDSDTKDPLIAANVIVRNTNLGAATDVEGYYSIVNIKPGLYTLVVDMIGYKQLVLENVRVSVNRTTMIDASLSPTVIQGETVVVEVDAITTKKDQTSTIKNISTDQIEKLAVEDLGAIVGMQAGVVEGHFRGGRTTEVTYLVDGIQIDEVFGGSSSMLSIEPDVIQDLEVITGTFNAEYGNAMSGVVNAVTKDGSNKFSGSFSTGFSEYITGNSNIFLGLDEFMFTRNQDYKFQLSGPVVKDKVFFFFNVRDQNNRNHLNGIRRFNVTDISNYYSDNPLLWSTQNTGDSSYVSMNRWSGSSLLGKLSFQIIDGVRFSTLYSTDRDEGYGYDHGFKYNPDGMGAGHGKTDFFSFQWNHLLSTNLFYDLKLSTTKNYSGGYLYNCLLYTSPSPRD